MTSVTSAPSATLPDGLTDAQFCERVRRWLQANLPADMVARARTSVHPSRDDILGNTALLATVGWSVPHWPVEHGGPGWSPQRRQLFEQELVLAGSPGNNIQGVSLVGPVIYTYGTEQQKQRYLAPIREGREFWAQGFSEPGSGSDLASLRTRAVRDGDHYVVDGQKIWTSQAMMADMLFCLVRTDPAAKPQRGISFLLIPMNSPGITVRPITSIDEGQSLCEVFLDAVRVPVTSLVGEEGRGWDYAKFLLGNERVQTAEVPRNKLYLAQLRDIASREQRNGAPLLADPVFGQQVAACEIDLLGLEAAVAQALDAQDDCAMTPSSLKVLGSELMQRTLGLQLQALGPYGAAFYPHSGHADPGSVPGPACAAGAAAEFLFRRAATIYGGSSEVQKNIIAKLLFAGQQGARTALTQDQAMLRDSATRLAQRDYPASGRVARRQASPGQARASWQRFSEAGFAALAQPADCGGFGGAAEMATVCEALGAGLVNEPFNGLVVQVGQLLAGLVMPDVQRAALLGALVEGRSVTALAHLDPPASAPGTGKAGGTGPTQARRSGNGYLLDGDKCLVTGGAIADRFIVSAQLDGDRTALFLLDATATGLTRRVFRTLDGQGVADLALRGVLLPASARLDQSGDAAPALARSLDWARVMACADAIGAMGEALRLTRDYLGTRRQFGSPLAEFQALRHRAAEMYAELTIAQALTGRAVAALDGDAAARASITAACKARVGRAALFVGSQAVQLHGGIGMTDEYLAGQFYKRLLVFDLTLGDQAFHTRAFADAQRSAALLS